MHITFGIDFDNGSWPGPLVGRQAVAGEAWVGPSGLLGLLETALGLSGNRDSEILRAAALIPALQATEGFWSESAAHNPLSAARALLHWRDELWMYGWRGEPLAPRLEQLAEVTADAEAGFPDRLLAVVEALADRRADIDRIDLCDPRDDLPPLWQAALVTLEARGTVVEERPLPPVAANGTLAAARAETAGETAINTTTEIDTTTPAETPTKTPTRTPAETPTTTPTETPAEAPTKTPADSPVEAPADPTATLAADGTLQLLRPYGVLAAADEVAAWLAALDDLDGTVLIGGDPVLDAALVRHGLPATGAGPIGGGTGGGSSSGGAGAASSILQILPLVLEMGWTPSDPQRALELLTLPISPIPKGVASRLAGALGESPAVDSDEWRDQLEKGLEKLSEAEYRARVEARIATFFTGTVPHSRPYPAGEIRSRVELLRSWFAARLKAEPKLAAFWHAGLDQCSALLAIVDRAGLTELPAAQLERFVQAAVGSVGVPHPFPSQAGLQTVRHPGAIVGEARRIVWWSFDLASAPAVRRLPVSASTHQALAAADIHLPDPGTQAVRLADRWRRPLHQAGEALLLVCPRHGADGGDLFPHPLWDELAGRHGADALADLESARPLFPEAPQRHRHPYTAPPRRTHTWTVPADLLPPRPVESPSSLSGLFGCSLKWALDYHARLRPSRAVIAGEALVLGNLLHEVVEQVLCEAPGTPKTAHARALELFDQLAPRRAAWLYLPGADSQLSQNRHNAAESVRQLTRLLHRAGLTVKSTEETVKGKTSGWTINGRIDLLLGDPPMVIDLKLGGAGYRRRELENGTAHALATYSYLSRQGSKSFPTVGYFILLEQLLLTNDSERFPTAEWVEGPSMQQTWTGIQRAMTASRQRLDAGELEAPGIPNADGEIVPRKTELVDGRLIVTPPCGFCDYAGLCGKAYEETA